MQFLNIKKNKQSKGFTLVEILLVVGFIALAGVGIYATYNKVQVSNQANVESRNIDTLRAGIKGLYGSKSVYTGLTNLVVNQAKISPETMRDPTTIGGAANATITHQFGGNVTIGPTPIVTPGKPDGGFEIVYVAVPSDICVKLGSSAAVQFDRVLVGTTVIKALGGELDPATIASSCNASTTPDMTFQSK